MRKTTLRGIGRGLALAVLLSVVPLGLAYRYFGLGSGAGQESAASLAKQAEESLAAVKQRDLKATLRPAKYDGILEPLDRMLRIVKDLLLDPSFNPVRDYEKVRSYCEPVMRIALEAHNQAQRETSFLRKDYRFMQQRGDACQYLATTMWNRLEAIHSESPADGNGDDVFRPTLADSEKLYAVIDAGLEADPENRHLWYLRGVLGKANGTFAAAEEDLRKAILLDSGYAAAWNVLGLVMIRLQKFGEAEKAFGAATEKAREAAERAGTPPDAEYFAALGNLARFHEALIVHYERAERIAPSSENKEELLRHRSGAEAALRDILSATPAGSPEHQDAQKRLSDLKP